MAMSEHSKEDEEDMANDLFGKDMELMGRIHETFEQYKPDIMVKKCQDWHEFMVGVSEDFLETVWFGGGMVPGKLNAYLQCPVFKDHISSIDKIGSMISGSNILSIRFYYDLAIILRHLTKRKELITMDAEYVELKDKINEVLAETEFRDIDDLFAKGMHEILYFFC